MPVPPHLRALERKAREASEGTVDGQLFTHFLHFMEAYDSQDTSLIDTVGAGYQLRQKDPPEHPDVVLVQNMMMILAKKRNPPPPSPPTFLSRDKILEEYTFLENLRKICKRGTIRQTVVTLVPEFTRKPLDSLSPTPISEMMLDHIHEDRYLICRVISKAVHMVAIQVAAEDREGNVVELAFYNCFETARVEPSSIPSILPIGQVILIRQPWLKPGSTGGTPTVRIDTPTDFMLLEHNHSILQDFPEDWKTPRYSNTDIYKTIGNGAYKQNNFEGAIRAYTTGLAVDPSASLLRLNRSICHLKLRNLTSALEDARAAWEDQSLPENSRSKARYRMAAACYALDRYSEALQILEEGEANKFSPEEAEGLRKKTQDRILEQTEGKYDWRALSEQAEKLKGTGPMVDVADYLGPVKVVAIEGIGGGRGLATTRAVRAGDLLARLHRWFSKPYTYASPLEFSELLRGFNAERSIVHERSLYELMGRTMRRVLGDPSAASALLLDVYPGVEYAPKTQPTTENDPPKPTFLSSGGRHWAIPDSYPTSHIDFNQIEGIVCDSSFSLPIKDYVLGKTESIYLLPSLVNHSCHATAVRNMVGSIMVLRASRDLKEGEAVTCSYAENVSVSYLSRAMELNRWIGGDCHCELCEADRSDGETNCQVREQCSAELAAIASNPNRNIKPVSGTFPLIKKTRSTYRDDRTLPREALGYVQMILAQAVEVKSRDVAILHHKDGLRSFGIRIKDVLPARVPQNPAELDRGDLIIETRSFPSQLSSINRVFLSMAALSFWEHQRGDKVRAGHWAVAAWWVNETFYGSQCYIGPNLTMRGGLMYSVGLTKYLKDF